MYTHTFTKRMSNGGDMDRTVTKSVSADSKVGYDDTIALNQTDKEIDIAITVANIKSLMILADVNMRVCTNAAHSGSPDQTLNLLAGESLEWQLGDLFANPLTTDITKLYVTTTTAGRLQVDVLVDNTP